MDPTRLSRRTLEALEEMPADKRQRAREVIARTQTPEARARDTTDLQKLEQEYRETGHLAVLGGQAGPEKRRRLLELIDQLRGRRIAEGLSLDEAARLSNLDEGVISRLEEGTPAGAWLATLDQYARGLGLELTFSLHPLTRLANEPSAAADDGPSVP